MGFTVLAYLILAVTGGWMFWNRTQLQERPLWLRPFHLGMGIFMAFLVLLLLAIGVVGTLGHYGSLGHSSHLIAGLAVVYLVMLSAWSALQISPQRLWAKPLHLTINGILLVGLIWVSLTGWQVVQKYLP